MRSPALSISSRPGGVRRTGPLPALVVLALAALGSLCGPRPLRAQDGGGWTPALSMRYRGVGGTAISAEGGLVAYVVRSAEMKGKESKWVSQIHVAAADGSSDRQYTQGEASASQPAFSPDGTELAFVSTRGGKDAKAQVWVLPLAGGEAWPLTTAATGVERFAWSPDGARIAYTSRDTVTSEEKKREEEKRDEYIVDSVFHYSHLYTVALAKDAEGKHAVTRLTSGKFQVRRFDWAPDGSAIVFAHQPDPRIGVGQVEADISVVPSTGGAVRPLVTRPGVDASPLYSPDGRTVAFTSNGGRPEPVGLNDVWVVPAQGGTPRKLADTPDREASLVAWSADGKTLYAEETVHTQTGIIVVPADGGPTRTLLPRTGVIGDVSLAARAPRFALTWQDPDTPADVYVSPTSAIEPTKLSAVNADVPEPPMGRTELVTWKSGPYTIEGLLTYPVGYTPGKKVPLILNVHGGPAGAFTQSFTGGPGAYLLQVFAQNGYAILRPNPRGSVGYGKAFRYANVDDWGGGDFRDLMAGVDRALAMGITTPDSLAEMGWSYGGYMTSWIVSHTNRFKAASMGAGLPDLVSMTMTTDIGDYLIAHMGGKLPWQDFKDYQAHSAMYAVENVKTPLQILHGAQDQRVPTFQGYEFYHALQRLGVPTQMVVFPRTPHGPREPKLLMDVTPHILAWFGEWVRGEGKAAAADR